MIIAALVVIAVKITSAKDYTGVAVSPLPVDEQVRVARSVRLSAVVNWGEGGPMYPREVVEAFLLGHPYPDFLDAKYGKPELCGRSKERNEIAFLRQSTIDHERTRIFYHYIIPPEAVYQRTINIYTRSGIYTIGLYVDRRGRIIRSWSNFNNPWRGPG